MVPVFELDTYFDTYGMQYLLVGAESREDIVSHLSEIFGDDYDEDAAKRLKREKWRIKKVEGLFTDTPYKILTGYTYIE